MRRLPRSKFPSKALLPCACFAQVLLLSLTPCITNADVPFPHPEHLEILTVPEHRNTYSVTFRWQAPDHVKSAAVAGSFNHWNPTANQMEAMDGGWFETTMTLAKGTHTYKFVANENQWIPDPLNETSVPDGHGSENSVLRLGLVAALHDVRGQRGDGVIEPRALFHDPDLHTYLDPLSTREGFIRFRTLAHDVEEVRLVLLDRGGRSTRHQMRLVGGDDLFDFFEIHVHGEHLEVEAAPIVAYTFEIRDGDATHHHRSAYPLVFDAERIVSVPEWAKGAVWYQVMVDRFRDGDPANNPEHLVGTGRTTRTNTWTADHKTLEPWEKDGDKELFEADGNQNNFPDIYERLYGGDLRGLKEKLGYLSDLGITALYLNPVFESTSHHKYNGKSFVHVDDGFGVAGEFARAMETHDPLDPDTWIYTESDRLLFKVLDTAHDHGIRVVLDAIFNHMGTEAPVFRDLRRHGQESTYADWFEVTSWEPFEYEGWGGFGGMPVFAKTDEGFVSETLTKHLFDVTRRWLAPGNDQPGIDGWRMDVADEIPLPFWRKWRPFVKAINEDALLIGEVWDPAEEYLDGKSFDATMNYPFRNIVLDFFGNVEERITASEFERRLGRLLIRYPRAVAHAQQNLVDSHDVDRIASRLMNPDLVDGLHYDSLNSAQEEWAEFNDNRPDDNAYRRLKLVSLFQYTWVGSPMVYYGTEVGMYGADDPMNRKPMWWPDRGPYDNPDYRIHEELLAWYQDLGRLRGNSEALRRGGYEPILADDDQEVFAFTRTHGDGGDDLLVVLNNGDEMARLTLKPSQLNGTPSTEPLIAIDSGIRIDGGSHDEVVMTLPPVAGAVFTLNKNTTPPRGLTSTNPSLEPGS